MRRQFHRLMVNIINVYISSLAARFNFSNVTLLYSYWSAVVPHYAVYGYDGGGTSVP